MDIQLLLLCHLGMCMDWVCLHAHSDTRSVYVVEVCPLGSVKDVSTKEGRRPSLVALPGTRAPGPCSWQYRPSSAQSPQGL